MHGERRVIQEGGMFEVGVVTHFEAAHHLRGDFGPATRLHGHTYRVEVAVRGPALGDDGALLDIGRLREAAEAACGELDYQNLDELSILEGRNTTAEVVAQHLARQIADQLPRLDLSWLRVRVWESPRAYAACAVALPAGPRE